MLRVTRYCHYRGSITTSIAFRSTSSIVSCSLSDGAASKNKSVIYRNNFGGVGSSKFISRRTLSTSSNQTWNWSKVLPNTNNQNREEQETSESSSSNTSDDNKPSPTEETQKKVLKKCAELYASLMPLNEKVNGPLEQQHYGEDENPENTIIGNNTKLPFVFLVGNHSSGKSSFINYVLGRDVQTAGVAPTDDCFTIITSGEGGKDMDQDGPALVFGNPELGFAPLKQFGPTLIHHLQLKVRTNISTQNFMMIDSPGMIDSPASTHGMLNADGNHNIMDRGYDFQGVVRWFAERADIVLLFFDPDKPGTTGETLSILLHSLSGMDHKLMIVLNKADQFKKIHDFARAYGSLCWNLSKVIPRKDLPRIFTMCLPVKSNKQEQAKLVENNEDATDDSSPTASSANPPPSTGGLADLHSTRDDVVAEVMKAPQRRIDNVITHLYDSVNLLHMHTRICQDLHSRYKQLYWQCKKQEMGWVASTIGVTGGIAYFLGTDGDMIQMLLGAMIGTGIGGTGGLTWYNKSRLHELERDLLSLEGLSLTFQRCYRREVSDGDEFTASIWSRIRDPLKASLEQQQQTGNNLGNTIPTISDGEIDNLKMIIEKEIPSLRRMVSPTSSSSSP